MKDRDGYQPFARTEIRDMPTIPLYFRATYTSRKKLRPSQVYFLRLGDTPYIKIGYSAAPHTRRKLLQRGCKLPLRWLAWVDGKQAVEYRFHCYFARLHTWSEWYHFPSALLEIDAFAPLLRTALDSFQMYPAVSGACPPRWHFPGCLADPPSITAAEIRAQQQADLQKLFAETEQKQRMVQVNRLISSISKDKTWPSSDLN